eukprot:Lithocolla_globosa_v1_NODE_332_length_4428_cov_206.625429.p2 type:complete len:250 gc:universal NODE_332_length_4428_cov_206.625429:2532-3281(+)
MMPLISLKFTEQPMYKQPKVMYYQIVNTTILGLFAELQAGFPLRLFQIMVADVYRNFFPCIEGAVCIRKAEEVATSGWEVHEQSAALFLRFFQKNGGQSIKLPPFYSWCHLIQVLDVIVALPSCSYLLFFPSTQFEVYNICVDLENEPCQYALFTTALFNGRNLVVVMLMLTSIVSIDMWTKVYTSLTIAGWCSYMLFVFSTHGDLFSANSTSQATMIGLYVFAAAHVVAVFIDSVQLNTKTSLERFQS